MGACNCKEDDNIDNGNIYASEIREDPNKMVSKGENPYLKPYSLYSEPIRVDSVKENANESKLCGSEIDKKSMKMAEYQTREGELPFSQYASVQISERGEQFNYNTIEDARFKENSLEKENDSEQEDSIVLSFEKEYKYTEFSTKILNLLNSLRTTPDKFVSEVDQSKMNVKI